MLPCRIQLKTIIQPIEVGEEAHLVAQTLSAAQFKASRPQGYGDVHLSRHPPWDLWAQPVLLRLTDSRVDNGPGSSSPQSSASSPKVASFFLFFPALRQENPCSSVSKGVPHHLNCTGWAARLFSSFFPLYEHFRRCSPIRANSSLCFPGPSPTTF